VEFLVQFDEPRFLSRRIESQGTPPHQLVVEDCSVVPDRRICDRSGNSL
jgi:hypothetical protein